MDVYFLFLFSFLTQIFYFQVLNQASGGSDSRIIGIEERRQGRRAYTQTNGIIEAPGDPYSREVDIILESANGGEEWIEVKSLNGPFRDIWFKNTIEPKKPRSDTSNEKHRSYYRQFFQDMRMNDDFINGTNRGKILKPKVRGTPNSTNEKFSWFFHGFKPPRGSSDRAPTSSDISKARKLLCEKSSGISQQKDFYKQNFEDGTISAVHNKCARQVNGIVELRTPSDYGVGFLQQHMEHLDIVDYVNIIQELAE